MLGSKLGRPRKDGAKSKRISIRLTEEDLDILDFIKYRTSEGTYEVFKKSIHMYYNLVKNR